MNTIRFSVKKVFFAVFTAVLAALLAFSLASGVFGLGENCEISSVTLNKSKGELTFEIKLTKEYVKANKSSTLYLFEFLPHESTSNINSMEPAKSFKANEKIIAKLAYYNGNMTRLYSKFAVAEQNADGSYNIISSAKYIENIGTLAENTEAYPNKSSKKGLQVQLFSDAQQLGAQHTVLNVAINEYMLGENSDAAQSFVYNGRTFYVDKARLAALDHTVKIYTDAGINVYFNIILTAPKADYHENIKCFYYDGISSEAKAYAVNTKNENSMKSFQAFMDYICARYMRTDHAHGFVPGIILGFEVNSNRMWNDAGDIDLTSYVYSYCTAFRVAYTAALSHYSEARVYVSLGNNFCTAQGTALADTQYGFPAKDFLDLFAQTIKTFGDIPWGLSVNPYPSDRTLTDYWNDTLAEDSFDTPFITMKNINTLTRYMNEEPLLYNSEPRSVIIGEFGVTGDASADNSMTLQASAYALAYYTVAQNEDIDAFIYKCHVDSSDGNLKYGLWTRVEGSTSTPAAKKPIYNVFSLIDTDQSEAATAFVKGTVGNNAFSAVIGEKVKYKIFDKRTVVTPTNADSSAFTKKYSEKVLFDLTGGKRNGFYPTDGTDYVELRVLEGDSDSILFAKLSGIPTEYKGIGNLISDGAFEKAHFITVRIMVSAPETANSLNLALRLQSNGDAENNTVVYEGETSVKPNEWQEVSFNIKDLVNASDADIDVIKLWVRTADASPEDGEYGIWLKDITLHTKKGMGFFGWFFTIILILVVLAVAGYGALYLRAQYIRKKRRAEAEMRRREMLRRQQMQQARQMNQIYTEAQYPDSQNTEDF